MQKESTCSSNILCWISHIWVFAVDLRLASRTLLFRHDLVRWFFFTHFVRKIGQEKEWLTYSLSTACSRCWSWRKSCYSNWRERCYSNWRESCYSNWRESCYRDGWFGCLCQWLQRLSRLIGSGHGLEGLHWLTG